MAPLLHDLALETDAVIQITCFLLFLLSR